MRTLSLAAPLVLFEKSRLWAGTRFHLLTSFHHHHHHHHPTLHSTITLTVTHTVTLTLTSYSTLYWYSSRPTVMWPAQAVRELKIDHTQRHHSIRLALNPKHVIVQWIGIGTPFAVNRTWTAAFAACSISQLIISVINMQSEAVI